MNQSLQGPVISAASPLIFMHLPKTGGMSMFTAFTGLWRTAIADLYNVSPRNAGRALSALKDRSKVLYCGHYSFGMHGWLDRPSYYASVLREPVSRLVSLYHYCQPMLAQYTKLLEQAGGELEKLKANPKLSDYYFDFLPCLRGESSPENFFASPSAELDNGMVRRFSGYGLNPEKCPDSALELAKKNIERYFSVVGLLERYPETLDLMSRTFGLPALKENHVNQNRPETKKKPLSDTVLSKIRDMNPLDIALYQWVSERFDQQLRVQKPVMLQPGGNTDKSGMPLWLGVGESPLREASMKNGGELAKSAKPVLLQRLTRMQVQGKSRLILADVDTLTKGESGQAQPGERLRLVINQDLARTLIDSLQKSIEVLERTPQTAGKSG